MIGLSHVALHVALCPLLARQGPQTTIAINVRLADSGKGTAYQHVFKFPRAEAGDSALEFDAPRGTYRLTLESEFARCSAVDWLFLIPDHDRVINETLVDGIATVPEPTLIAGIAPTGFSYAQPTFVLLEKSVVCKAPIGTPVAATVALEHERDAYYTWLYSNAAIDALGSVTPALRLRTPTGQFHYVRLTIPFPTPWQGWPPTIQFNVTEDELDEIVGEPVDVLLCPKLWKTQAG